MPNFKGRTSVQNRLGRVTRIEYVNRLGDPVDPKTGRPFNRPVGHIKENFGRRSKKPLVITASPRNINTPKKATSQENGTSRRKSHFPIKTRGTMFGGLDPIPFDPTRDPPPRVCYNCWQPGHARRQCTRPVVTKVCNNCGRRGEDLSSCPRCSKAHKVYLIRVQAKERGEFLEPSEIDQLLSGNGEDEEVEEEFDDALRQVIYRDDLAREQLMYGENPREPLYTRQAQEDLLLEAEVRAREEEALLLQREREREEEALLLQREREREEILFLEKQREREEERLRKEREWRERERDMLERQRERERREERERERRERESREPLFAGRDQSRENQERRIADLIHSKEPEKNNDWGRDVRSVKYEYYNHRPENSFNAARHSSITPASSSDLETSEDPVKEILELTKSISHLSPETQEMIMRQVLAERKEKARFRPSTELKERVVEREPQRKWDVDGVDDDPWA